MICCFSYTFRILQFSSLNRSGRIRLGQARWLSSNNSNSPTICWAVLNKYDLECGLALLEHIVKSLCGNGGAIPDGLAARVTHDPLGWARNNKFNLKRLLLHLLLLLHGSLVIFHKLSHMASNKNRRRRRRRDGPSKSLYWRRDGLDSLLRWLLTGSFSITIILIGGWATRFDYHPLMIVTC